MTGQLNNDIECVAKSNVILFPYINVNTVLLTYVNSLWDSLISIIGHPCRERGTLFGGRWTVDGGRTVHSAQHTLIFYYPCNIVERE